VKPKTKKSTSFLERMRRRAGTASAKGGGGGQTAVTQKGDTKKKQLWGFGSDTSTVSVRFERCRDCGKKAPLEYHGVCCEGHHYTTSTPIQGVKRKVYRG